MPVPTGYDLDLATWNVEGLREIAKCDQILTFAKSRQIQLLAVQEIKTKSVSTFQKSGWEILHPGAPNARHHGVGFFASPSLRLHVRDFLAYSPRICELTIHTNPHPITVFSVYAPSTVEDSTEDIARKDHFWSQLDSIITEHRNSSYLLILENLNSRLDGLIDPDQDHIGPHVWGQRQSIEDPHVTMPYTVYDLMQSHLLMLPKTYQELPSSKLVSYKEMTSTTDFLEDFEVTDWTTLDYGVASHPIFSDLQFSGSIFQQAVNSRHLPLLFRYRTTFLPISSGPPAPRLDYSHTEEFYASVEASLLQSIGCTLCNENSMGQYLMHIQMVPAQTTARLAPTTQQVGDSLPTPQAPHL